MTTTPATAAEQTPNPNAPVVARAGRYYRNMRYLMAVLLVGMGAWFGYDGFVAWPKMNVQIRDLTAQREAAVRAGDKAKSEQLLTELNKLNKGKEKTDWDIGLQKFLCFTLPPLGLFILIRALYNSRGEYRLEGTTLSVPGHPPVPFENITEIDRRLWDRKGIAYISYDLGNGQKGRLKLDDFLYDRPPTDEIFNRIEAYVSPPSEEAKKPADEVSSA